MWLLLLLLLVLVVPRPVEAEALLLERFCVVARRRAVQSVVESSAVGGEYQEITSFVVNDRRIYKKCTYGANKYCTVYSTRTHRCCLYWCHDCAATKKTCCDAIRNKVNVQFVFQNFQKARIGYTSFGFVLS